MVADGGFIVVDGDLIVVDGDLLVVDGGCFFADYTLPRVFLPPQTNDFDPFSWHRTSPRHLRGGIHKHNAETAVDRNLFILILQSLPKMQYRFEEKKSSFREYTVGVSLRYTTS